MEERALGARYVVGDRIGGGAMGEVFEGRARSNGEPVAIKYLRPEFAANHDIVTRFIQERAILQAIHGPHVVGVRELVFDGGELAIVMELVDGKDLRRRLDARGGRLPEHEAIVVCSQVLQGLVDVHAAGVIHRDVKPENVLIALSDDGAITAKISDFGIARFAQGQRFTQYPGLIGTLPYIAPEVARQDDSVPKATKAVDVYAVGIMCYELIAGRPPFESPKRDELLRQHERSVPTRPDGMSAELWTIVARMLAKNPAQRPTAATAAAEMNKLVGAAAGGASGDDADGVRWNESAATTSSLGAGESDWWDGWQSDSHSGDGGTGGDDASGSQGAADDDDSGGDSSGNQPGDRRSRHERRPRHKRLIGAAATSIAAMLVAGVAIAAFVASGGNSAKPNGPTTTVPGINYFQQGWPRLQLAHGLELANVWTVSEGRGELRAAMTVRNPGTASAPLDMRLNLPKDLVDDADKVRWRPQPTVEQKDPLVRYRANVPPGRSMQLSYAISLPGDVDAATLKGWLQSTYAAFVLLNSPKQLPLKIALHAPGCHGTPCVLTLGKDNTQQLVPTVTQGGEPVSADGIVYFSSKDTMVRVNAAGLVVGVGVTPNDSTVSVTAKIGFDTPTAPAATDIIDFVVKVEPGAPIGKPVAYFTCKAGNLSVSCDGTQSYDPAGGAPSLAWDMGDGTKLTGLTVTHRYDEQGTYTVKLVATSPKSGKSSEEFRTVMTVTPYDAPIADPVCEVNTLKVSCDGSKSRADSHTELKSYSWDWGDGSEPSDGKQATHDYDTGGSYTVTLVVRDKLDQVSEPASTPVQPNRAPTAVNGGGSSLTSLTVTLDGSASKDPDGDPLSFDWDCGAPGVSPVGSGAKVTCTYLNGGTYSTSLVVSDGQTDSDSSPADAVANQAPIVSPTVVSKDQLTVTLDSGAHDADGDALVYEWSCDAAGVSPSPQGAASTTCTYTTDGTYHPSVTATDPQQQTDSGNTEVAVAANKSPNASISGTARSSGAFPFDGSASSDPDGDALTYKWSFGDGETSTDAKPSAHSYARSGVYDVTLQVTDTHGSSSQATATVAVAVIQATAADTNPVSVDGRSGGQSLTYGWDCGGGSLDDSDDGTASCAYDGAADYTITLTISDGTHSDSTSVQVHAADPQIVSTQTVAGRARARSAFHRES